MTFLIAMLAMSHVAHAEGPKELLAHFASTEVAHVDTAVGYRLAGAGPWTHLVYGSYEESKYHHSIIVLLKCNDKQCEGRPIWLGNSPFVVRGTIDLDGKAAPLPTGQLERAWSNFNAELLMKGLRWPALVIEKLDDGPARDDETSHGTKVHGSEHHHAIVVVSLRASESTHPNIGELPTEDMYPTGAGVTITYTLDRGRHKDALDIVGLEQRHIESDLACIRPDPVTVRWTWHEGRYQRADLLARHGC